MPDGIKRSLLQWPHTTACPDWEHRIRTGQSLIPCGPIFDATAAVGLDNFCRLPVADLPRIDTGDVDEHGNPVLRPTTFGDVSGQWVLDIVTAIFGANNPETCEQVIKEIFLLISKKNGKSTDLAGIIMTALLMSARPFSEMGILAPTVEVANNAWRPARDMIALNDELKSTLHVQEHVRTITHRITGCTLQVVAAEAESVAGKKWAVTLVDELWLFGKRANADKMLAEATGGLASRAEGFVLYSSTQSDEPPAGVFKEKLKYARDVRDGKVIDPHFLPILYEFPKDMIESEAFTRLENLGMVNPNLGRSVSESFLKRELDKAMRGDEKAKRIFFSKHADVEIGMTLYDDGWAAAPFWLHTGDKALTLDALLERSEVVTAGIDGGGLDDLLGLSLIGREKGTKRWLHWAHAWAHEIVLKRHQDIAPRLRDFEQLSELTIVNKPGEDLEQLIAYLIRVRDLRLFPKTRAIGVDAAGMPSLKRALADSKFGEDMVEGISQGWKLNAIIKTLERMVSAGTGVQFLHGMQELMTWSVGNAKVVPVGNAITITKQVSGTAKIDPLMATFDAASLMALNPEATRKSFNIHFV